MMEKEEGLMRISNNEQGITNIEISPAQWLLPGSEENIE
jgi:hypothetical protein